MRYAANKVSLLAALITLSSCWKVNEDYCLSNSDCSGMKPYCDLDGRYHPSGASNFCVPWPGDIQQDAGPFDGGEGLVDQGPVDQGPADLGVDDLGPDYHTLTVRLEGEGEGKVIALPDRRINCPGTCMIEAMAGEMVTLVAQEDLDTSTFAGWQGACSGEGPCVVHVIEDVEVTASFERRSFDLVVSLAGDGRGRVNAALPGQIECGEGLTDCAHSYPAGAEVTLVATPIGQSRFGGWSGVCSGQEPSCTVRVEAMTLVTAAFDLNRVSLNVTIEGDGSVRALDGTLECPASNCTQSYLLGSEVTLDAAAAPQRIFVGWRGAPSCQTTSSCTVQMDAARTVVASFEEERYTLMVNVTGQGRVSSMPKGIDCPGVCSASFTAGTSITLEASALRGSQFAGWSGACAGAGACGVLLDGDRAVDALFELIPPVLTNGQSASIVLGQTNFMGSSANAGLSVQPWSLSSPGACAADGNSLFVADNSNTRVLRWPAPPSMSQASAGIAIGQADLRSFNNNETSATNIRFEKHSVAVDNGRLFVTDYVDNRILIYNTIPTTSGQAASLVLGQSSFTSRTSGISASKLNAPRGITVAQGKLIVADSGNNRVLIWNSIPQSSGEHPADVVLGQPNFFSTNAPSPPSASSMQIPVDVHYDPDTDQLFVVDEGNHRVLVWAGVPAVNGAPANYALGQPGLSSGGINRGQGVGQTAQDSLHAPRAVVSGHGSLFVTDLGNNRVLAWTPTPISGAELPRAVLGRETFDAPGVVSNGASRFNTPDGLCVLQNFLWVVDTTNHRALRFDLILP